MVAIGARAIGDGSGDGGGVVTTIIVYTKRFRVIIN